MVELKLKNKATNSSHKHDKLADLRKNNQSLHFWIKRKSTSIFHKDFLSVIVVAAF